MQDNVPIHTAQKVKDWFEENSIQIIDWPLYLPDLNLIKHTQYVLKKQVLKIFPEIINNTEKSEEDYKNLQRALKVAQKALPDSFFESLIESMPQRIEACITANGWHIKY